MVVEVPGSEKIDLDTVPIEQLVLKLGCYGLASPSASEGENCMGGPEDEKPLAGGGDTADVKLADDVYSAGLIAYELRTKSAPGTSGNERKLQPR